jgi:phosphate transport system protein
MPVHLTHDLDRLKKDILEYGSAIDQNFVRAIKALEVVDNALAARVIDHDEDLDKTEVEIEDKCLKILALHQPVARDLRFVVTVLKINNDLERIGDFAVNIANRTQYLANHKPITIPPILFEMAVKARNMVSRSLDALVEGDSHLARTVCRDDDEVDQMSGKLYGIVRDAFRENPDYVGEWMRIFSINRYLERVGDQATNIAEDVIYLVEGEVIRHRMLDQDE